jgi:hypothetical protein
MMAGLRVRPYLSSPASHTGAGNRRTPRLVSDVEFRFCEENGGTGAAYVIVSMVATHRRGQNSQHVFYRKSIDASERRSQAVEFPDDRVFALKCFRQARSTGIP